MAIHTDRAADRAKNSNPINFTCGICRKVHPFNEGYKCTEQEEESEEA